MARTSLVIWSALLTSVLVSGPAHAQVAGPFAAPEARVVRAPAGQSLAPVSGDPVAQVAAYLRAAGHDDATVASLVLASRDTVARTGVTHLRFTQRVSGLDVYGTYLKASVTATGALASVVENVVTVRAVGGPPLDGGEGRALAIGLQHVHGGAPTPPGLVRQDGNTSVFARTAFFHREPTVTRVAVPVGAALRLGYLVETWTARGNQLHHTLVGGDGAVLGVESRTSNDSYNVFAIDPSKSQQQVVNGSAADRDRVAQRLAVCRHADDDQHRRQQRQCLPRRRRQQLRRWRRHRRHEHRFPRHVPSRRAAWRHQQQGGRDTEPVLPEQRDSTTSCTVTDSRSRRATFRRTTSA